MHEVNQFCYNCMHKKGNIQKCPQCGWNKEKLNNSPHHLTPGTVLHKKYIIGSVLGEGGFGVTYLARDLQLDMKLAIKEYFPKDFATRQTGQEHISVFTGNAKDHFSNGLEKFVEEAKILAKYNNLPGIVSVRDYFEENNTAYLVMYYLEGIDLKSYLEQLGGKIPCDQAIQILIPVMEALKEIHKDGLLHRDISPENIYVTTEGEIKLLDFGAARHAFNDHNKSLSVILKPGYAPEEQYRTRGRQGPWTDVYAVAATLYRMIVGKTPPDSLDRLEADTLILPSRLNINIPLHIEHALQKALTVKSQQRFQTLEDFQKAIFNNVPPYHYESHHEPPSHQQTMKHHEYNTLMQPINNSNFPQQKKGPTNNQKKKKIILFSSIFGGVLILAIGLFFIGRHFFFQADPNPIQQKVSNNHIEQTNNEQKKSTKDSKPVVVQVPYLYDLTEENAISELEKVNLKANIIYEEDLLIEKGTVIKQGVQPETEIEVESIVDVYVNSGVTPPVDFSTVNNADELIDVYEQYYWEMGYQAFDQGQYENALTYMLQSYEVLQELYSYYGENDTVLIFEESLLLLDIGLTKARMGNYYYGYLDTHNGVRRMEELITQNPEQYKNQAGYAYNQLATLQIFNFYPDDALESSTLAIKYVPNSNDYSLILAHGYLLTGKDQDAFEIYTTLWNQEDPKYQEWITSDFDLLLSIGYPSDIISNMRKRLYDS